VTPRSINWAPMMPMGELERKLTTRAFVESRFTLREIEEAKKTIEEIEKNA